MMTVECAAFNKRGVNTISCGIILEAYSHTTLQPPLPPFPRTALNCRLPAVRWMVRDGPSLYDHGKFFYQPSLLPVSFAF